MASMQQSKNRSLESMILLLVMLHIAEDEGYSSLTKTQIHKFHFLIQRLLIKKRILATGFRFHKMPQGPWSTDIENSLVVLEKGGLLKTTSIETIRGAEAMMTTITPKGKEISEYELMYMNESPDTEILEAMKDIIKEYGAYDSESLANVTHCMRNLVTRQLIDDIPHGSYVQKPITSRKAEEIYEPHEDVEDTIDILLDSELMDAIDRSIESARKGKLIVLSSIDDLEDC